MIRGCIPDTKTAPETGAPAASASATSTLPLLMPTITALRPLAASAWAAATASLGEVVTIARMPARWNLLSLRTRKSWGTAPAEPGMRTTALAAIAGSCPKQSAMAAKATATNDRIPAPTGSCATPSGGAPHATYHCSSGLSSSLAAPFLLTAGQEPQKERGAEHGGEDAERRLDAADTARKGVDHQHEGGTEQHRGGQQAMEIGPDQHARDMRDHEPDP